MSSGLCRLSVQLLWEVQSLNLECVDLVQLFKSVLGKTGLLGGGGLFWDLSGLVKLRELLLVCVQLLEELLALRRFWFSLTLQ